MTVARKVTVRVTVIEPGADMQPAGQPPKLLELKPPEQPAHIMAAVSVPAFQIRKASFR